MSVEILPALSSQIANAQRIIEPLVLRTNEGAVCTIEISKPLTDTSSLGAKVTLMLNPPKHLGNCMGETIEQVRTAAQELIATALAEGLPGSAAAAA